MAIPEESEGNSASLTPSGFRGQVNGERNFEDRFSSLVPKDEIFVQNQKSKQSSRDPNPNVPKTIEIERLDSSSLLLENPSAPQLQKQPSIKGSLPHFHECQQIDKADDALSNDEENEESSP